ncbi:hypothetical protein E0I74_04935 [Rhizobium laguerreae]|uniref:hypothetical protein n=1 Tax=Rhizobium laguerreae TaxID=1076926 RepID=UPI00103B11E1|nr:hypothetical protein [Rhizobium laguerreae]TBX81895.1 hypothetical protein E0I74_04935 [Rhizobium laguerreae]
MLEDYEKDALYGLTVKYLMDLRERRRVSDELAALQVRLDEIHSNLFRLKEAYTAFNIEDSDRFFQHIGEMIGEDRITKAYKLAGYMNDSSSEPAPDESASGKGLNMLLDWGAVEDVGEEVNIKDLVLRELRKASSHGTTAREIIDTLRKEGIEMHDKTVGMTLYRLSREERARRDGRRWFTSDTTEGDLMPPVDIFS